MPDFVTSALATVTLLALVVAAAAVWQLRRRRTPAQRQPALLQAGQRNAELDAHIAALTKERDLLVQIQALGKTGYVIADLDSKRVYWSDSMFEIRRVPRREFIPWDEAMAFFHPDDLPQYLAQRAAAIAERRDWEFSSRILRGDGTIGWERAVGRPQFDAAGNLTGIVFFLQDVTDRTAAEEEQRRLSLVATNTTNSVLISNLDGILEWVNEAFTRATGYSLAEVRGRRAMDLLRGPASDPATIALARERISRGEGIRNVEMLNYTKAGEPYWVNVEVQPIRDPDGKVVQFISVGTDITARKAADQRIRELNESLAASLRQLRAIADNIPALIVYLDAERRFRFMNRTAEQWLAAGFAQIEGKTVEEAMPDDYVRSTRSARSRLADGRNREEVTLRYPDGVLRTVDAAYVRDVDGAGRLLGYYVLVIDISERKAAELQLSRSQEHLANAQVAAAIGSAEIDLQTGVATWSEALFRLCGLDPAAGSPDGPGFARLVHPDDRSLVLDVTARVRQGIPIEPLEIRVLLPDGGMRWFRRRQKLIDGPDGKPIRAIVSMQDVTQARAAEQKILELNESLAASLRQLRAIADNLPALIVYLDAERRHRFINQTAERWFATSFKELEGKTFDEAMPADFVRSTQAARRRMESGAAREETSIHYPDGVTRTVDTAYVRDVDASGRLRGYYVFAVDVSERKAAELAIEESRARFAGAFQNSIDAMTVATVGREPGTGILLDVNEAAEQLLGFSRAEMVGGTTAVMGVYVNPDDIRVYRDRVLAETQVRNMPVRLRRKDGQVIDTLLSGSQFSAGGKTYVITVIRDVTEARAAERKILQLNESLAASLRQLRAIADNVPALIVYIDAEGRYRFLNRTAERWLGVTAEDAMGKTAAEALPADYVAATAADRALLYRGALRKEDAVRYPDGVMRTVDITSVPDLDPDGRIRGHYAFAVDISERKAMEEQLRQSQKLEAIGKLTGGVAHDFNNLLAVISGNLELADEALKDREDVQNFLRPAIRATERGAALTQSLLAYARRQPLSPSAVDLSGLVREMTDLLRRTVLASIEFKLDVGAGLWRCLVDPGQLQNALLNLVVNARDAMPDGGRLTIEIANARLDDDYAAAHAEVTPGDYVVLAVSDTGTGMAPDVAAHAFEPFFTTKEVGKGTGLGLSMVYGFAKQSLGHVKIYSEVGHGTTVRVYLPRAGDEAAAAAEAAPDELRGHGEVILVVEDDADLRTVAFALLRSLGYDVREAASAEAALRILQTTADISLMLTDVMLPGSMNGRQLAESVAIDRPHMQVLYMSGYTENAILHQGRLDQGVNFLQKPFSKSELARRVRLMLDQASKS